MRGNGTGRDCRAPSAWPLTVVTVFASYTLFRRDRSGASPRSAAACSGERLRLEGTPLSVSGNSSSGSCWALALVLLARTAKRVLAWRWTTDWVYAFAVAALLVLSVLHIEAPAPFYYFQF